jgi:hypothetical protein
MTCEALLTWNAPETGGDAYNIYRDDALIASNILATSYTDEDFNRCDHHTWSVTVICDDDESEPVNKEIASCIASCLHTITATATNGGEISPSGEIEVFEGENQLFTIIPEPNNQIIDVLVDAISKGAITEYLFENVDENHTIHAIFDYVGINDLVNNHPSLRVVPNPANDYIELQITNCELQINQIEFYNAFGQLVKSIPYNAIIKDNTMIQRISTADLSKGIYLIKAGNETAKLVVSN